MASGMDPLWLHAIPAAVALFGWHRVWLTVDGAVAGFLVGSAVVDAGWDVTAMLFLFFFLGSYFTKLAAKLAGKGEADKDAKRGRNAWQVLATAGIPALLCVFRNSAWWLTDWKLYFFAYMACGCGDTLASEIGRMSGDTPILITTFQKVKAGRDGGVSFTGTLASLLGGLAIGICGGTCVAAGLGALFGGIGSILDSYLGAVLQATCDFEGQTGRWKSLNNVVNLLSSLLTVACAALVRAFPLSAQLLLSVVAFVLLCTYGPWNERMQHRLDLFAVLLLLVVGTLLAAAVAWVRCAECDGGFLALGVSYCAIPLALAAFLGMGILSQAPSKSAEQLTRMVTEMRDRNARLQLQMQRLGQEAHGRGPDAPSSRGSMTVSTVNTTSITPATTAAMDRLTARLEEEVVRSRQLDNELQGAQGRLQDRARELDRLRARCEVAVGERESMEARAKAGAARLTELERHLRDGDKAAQKAAKTAQQQQSHLKKEKEALATKLYRLEAEHKLTAEELHSAQDQLATVTTTNRELTAAAATAAAAAAAAAAAKTTTTSTTTSSSSSSSSSRKETGTASDEARAPSAALVALREEVQQRDKTVDGLKARISELNAALRERDALVKERDLQLAEFNGILKTSLEIAKEKYETQMATLHEQHLAILETKEQEVITITQQMEIRDERGNLVDPVVVVRKLDSATARVAKLTSDLQMLQRQGKARTGTAAGTTVTARELERVTAELSASAIALRERERELAASRQQLRDLELAATRETADRGTALQAAGARTATLEAQLRERERHITLLRAEAEESKPDDALAAELAAVHARNRALRAEVEERDHSLAALQAQVSAHELEALSPASGNHAEELALLESRCLNLQNENATLTDRLAVLHRKHSESVALSETPALRTGPAVAELQLQVKALQTDKLALQIKARGFEEAALSAAGPAEVAAAREEQARLTQRIRALEADKAALHSELTEVRSSTTSKTTTVVREDPAAAEALEALRRDNQRLLAAANNARRLEAEKQTLEMTVSHLRSKLAVLEKGDQGDEVRRLRLRLRKLESAGGLAFEELADRLHDSEERRKRLGDTSVQPSPSPGRVATDEFFHKLVSPRHSSPRSVGADYESRSTSVSVSASPVHTTHTSRTRAGLLASGSASAAGSPLASPAGSNSSLLRCSPPYDTAAPEPCKRRPTIQIEDVIEMGVPGADDDARWTGHHPAVQRRLDSPTKPQIVVAETVTDASPTRDSDDMWLPHGLVQAGAVAVVGAGTGVAARALASSASSSYAARTASSSSTVVTSTSTVSTTTQSSSFTSSNSNGGGGIGGSVSPVSPRSTTTRST